jgi:enterochelin esterase family protein
MPSEGVPRGVVSKHNWTKSSLYPGTETDYWIYVPKQYTDDQSACVMVFQDGKDYMDPEGLVRVPTVMDNLIHRGEIPITIGVFINPSTKEQPMDQRETQYVPINDTYARFVLEEILPEVSRHYKLVDDASGRAIAGMSDGGLVSFTVAWHRPDAFSKVISHIGSYTRLRGGSEYPYRIRKTRGNPKPIRVFLQDGANDLNLVEGNWTLANLNMESALMFARYDYSFEMGTGGHTLKHGGAIFPDTLRWIWRDYPGVSTNSIKLDAVLGQWNVVTNVYGLVMESLLTISEQGGGLVAKLHDATEGDLEVTDISFKDDVLEYEYLTPASQSKLNSKKAEGASSTMKAWLKVKGDAFKGALSSGENSEFDFSVTGQRVSPGENTP